MSEPLTVNHASGTNHTQEVINKRKFSLISNFRAESSRNNLLLFTLDKVFDIDK